MTNIYCIRIINADGSEDMEFLDRAPSTSFVQGLAALLDTDRIQYFCIREGSINGGDSRVVLTSIPGE